MFELPRKVAALMRRFELPWFVAGGWAIDLFLGERTRPHDDIEIVVFRRDQIAMQNHLRDWSLKKARGGELSDWRRNEILQLPVHEIHCFNETAEPSELEVLLNETDGEKWIYRRDERVTKPLGEVHSATSSGIKFLRPETVLLYKSKNPRPKDERDFRATVTRLDSASRNWLKNAISVCDARHAWLKVLEDL